MESPELGSMVEAWPAPLQPLPRGPHRLPREAVVRSQRSRLLRALVEVVADKGYPATTVADITGRAGVSRSTFYDLFRDKEDCFLAAYRRGADAQFRMVVAAVNAVADPLEKMRGNLRAYLAALTGYPPAARAFLLEVAAAGPRALAIRDSLQLRYVDLLRELHGHFRTRNPALPELPPDVFRSAVAAVEDLVVRWIRDGRLAELNRLEPTAVYVELALFGLPDAAAVLAPE